jgi:NDP-sugar pyrophosphorylase family protein
MKPTIQELYDLTAFAHAAIFDGVTYPWEVLPKINDYILAHTTDQEKNILIGNNVVIEPGVHIIGPAIIGDNVTLRSGAYIRENVIIGANTIIGNSCEIKNSIIMNDAQVPHFNYVGDSILGNHTHLSGGAILSNTTMFGKTVTITDTTGTQYDTSLQKCGSMLGDYAEVGSNAVLSPGTVIGKRSLIYPLAFIRDMIPADRIVKIRQQQEQVERRS